MNFKKEDKSFLPFYEWYREGSGTENVGPFLESLIVLTRPLRILEIGIGYTTPFIIEGLKKNDRVIKDINSDENYFKKTYDPKLVLIDNFTEYSDISTLKDTVELNKSSKNIELIKDNFEGKADILKQKYSYFDFVFMDCGGVKEYDSFMKEYWNMCTGFVIFHFTYYKGMPNELHETIFQNLKGNINYLDIIEPHKFKQGSLTVLKK